MSDLVGNYRSGLAAALLESQVVRIGYDDQGEGVRVDVNPVVTGQPGSQLHDIAAFGYGMALVESGLMHPDDESMGVIAFADMQPLVSRVLRETIGRDWQTADEEPDIANVDLLTPSLSPVVMFDTTLDLTSVELAKAANRYGQLVGMIALLDMQRGVRTALRQQAGVERVHAVIRLEDIIRHVMFKDEGPITRRDCVHILQQIGADEA